MGLDFRDPLWATFDLRDWLPQFAALGRKYSTPAPKPKPLDKVLIGGVIDPDVALAIMDVEAGGAGFAADGRMIIRFEAHIFRQRLACDSRFYEHFQIADQRPWAAPQYYRENAGDPERLIHSGRQADEWAALRVAMNLDPKAALESTSMGIAQIMGFNHGRVGYADVHRMFAEYQLSEAAQIVGFFNYMLTDADLLRAVHDKDWRTIARHYNGAGAVDIYAPRLEAAYKRRLSV